MTSLLGRGDSHCGSGDQRGPRPQAREHCAHEPWPREENRDRQGPHDRDRRRRREERDRGPLPADRKQLEASTSDYEREKLQERLAKLSGGVAIIRVGAATESEMKEKKA